MILYDCLDSGNGCKIRLLLAQLVRDYRWVELDILQVGEPAQTRTAHGPPGLSGAAGLVAPAARCLHPSVDRPPPAGPGISYIGEWKPIPRASLPLPRVRLVPLNR